MAVEHTEGTLTVGALAASIAANLYLAAHPAGKLDAKLADPDWAVAKQQAAQLVTDMEAWAYADLVAVTAPPTPTPPPAPVAPSPPAGARGATP